MLGMSINLFAQEKYGEEFIFSQDKSTVTSYYTKTSYEPLKTYGISSISPYYLSLSQRPDTIIRNAILSPTDQYNYPGDSLVRKLFLKTKVFHRYMVVDRFTSEIYLKIVEKFTFNLKFKSKSI